LLQLFTTDFFLLALCAGIALACVCGPLGCFIVWRRMSFFGDTLAHSALLGIALGLATNSDPQLSIVASGLLLAFLLSILEKNSLVSTDTLLGILAHSTLAIGVVFLALTDNIRVNIEAYLFGDMLTISRSNLIWIAAISLAVGLTLYRFWNDFLSITVHAELAEIEASMYSECVCCSSF
jgi:zinc transport system permease protein